ncbi:TIGR03751 family conjugal transfer lipoprotein [Erwinia tracheiphila]|uniref:TIGR03751 family conjugal transfer lipoprotein n=1 Tax=Erwinia tracheiphila TaxID=65700 RepID=A0A345CU52_9GAMM|nr:TIGR03751 family conjugal transfer lipoprotein [Erwinia tracheiphila]AXF76969.1 TIGR03751 family conjugal transfer lipoprotein [Erwinia tracheiphila]AXF77496.1 TIGR03751 family conjugal transfer lipoprotein [Erwinia tracheiphila]UIA83812.1 TIGR03751 family conjugal transfer lipoprotein [Erwinia tracheiphila]UIA92392.1 TIGR03751 family conjugal transfer lipoprotein [Erwinia tracheiphila]UIA92937.1 TIGR03751 family conjugal transfer lipoprotein [Erwinia tracheiphila]
MNRYKLLATLLLAVTLAGCSTSKDEMLPPGDSSMLDMWNDGASVTHTTTESRATLSRPVSDGERVISQQTRESYSRTQENEIQQTFPRLPNPDMVMYVYPHLADGSTPVPGYSTVFPFYSQVQYALPGERTEDL